MNIIIEHNRGFTLTEVVISIAILTVVSIPLIGLLNVIMVKSSPEDQMHSCLIAQNAMENTLLMKSFDDDSFEVIEDNKSFVCERKTTHISNLIKISLRARRSNSEKEINLVRYVYTNDQEEE